jgi:tetratricopeptide (TPR) repeat protein
VTSKTSGLAPVTFGLGWFMLALLPASSIVPLAEVSNEHRVFFPYVGALLAAAWAVPYFAERWSAAKPALAPLAMRCAAVVSVAAIAGNAAGAYARNRTWRTEETLWRDVTLKSPANGRGWMNYGLTQMALGRYVAAKEMFETAARYTPDYATLEVNLGIVTSHLGDARAAESHFRRAIELRPDDPTSYSFYGEWLVGQERAGEGIPLLERSVALSPAIIDARYALMNAYARTGRVEELEEAARQTLALAPLDSLALRYLKDGLAPANDGRPLPATAADWLNTSLEQYQAGNYQASIDAARKALALQPGYADAYNNLSAAFAAQQRWDEAIDAATEALRLDPSFLLARNNLAWAEQGRRSARRTGP